MEDHLVLLFYQYQRLYSNKVSLWPQINPQVFIFMREHQCPARWLPQPPLRKLCTLVLQRHHTFKEVLFFTTMLLIHRQLQLLLPPEMTKTQIVSIFLRYFLFFFNFINYFSIPSPIHPLHWIICCSVSSIWSPSGPYTRPYTIQHNQSASDCASAI